jgi:hypothetical protein
MIVRDSRSLLLVFILLSNLVPNRINLYEIELRDFVKSLFLRLTKLIFESGVLQLITYSN